MKKKIMKRFLAGMLCIFIVFTNEGIVYASGLPKEEETIKWEIDSNGCLTVTGTGDVVKEYSGSRREAIPWYADREKIVSARIEVSGMTDASDLFYGCSNMTSIDVSEFDTSQVTDMSHMFSGCSSLTELDLSNFASYQVTNMAYMFSDCSGLTTLDLADFDTAQVTDMYGMFSNCESLEELSLDSFDTAQVTDMSCMFEGCHSLINIDLSSFDTCQVKAMTGMFNECVGLTELNLGNFDTGQVTAMSGMFSNCSSITQLDLIGFDTSRVSNMENMFDECINLAELDLSDFDTSQVTDMSGMFNNCSGLTELDLSNFSTHQVTNMMYMFSGCGSLTELNVKSFDTSRVTNMYSMFAYCKNLEELDLSSFDVGMVGDGNMEMLFNGCDRLLHMQTPMNVTQKVPLTPSSAGIPWHKDGNVYQELPMNLSYSVAMTRDKNTDWTDISVIFDLRGHGSGFGYSGINLGDLIPKPEDPKADGYIFKGWYKNGGCMTLWDFAADTVTEDDIIDGVIILYASWEKISQEPETSGSCGNELKWEVSGAQDGHTLSISGTGEMTDYSASESVPWYVHASSIKSIVVNQGVVSIGNYAFKDIDHVGGIVLPEGVQSIGEHAFYSCDDLKYVEIPESVLKVKDAAFDQCSNLMEMIFCGDAPEFGANCLPNNENVTIYYPESASGWDSGLLDEYDLCTWETWDAQAKSRDIVLLLDVSGSMGGKTDKLRNSVNTFVESMGGRLKNTRVSIVIYNTSATMLSGLSTNKEELMALTDKINASGGTAYLKALESADELLKTSNADQKIVVMFSDGEPEDSTSSIYAKAKTLREKYKIYTVGLVDSTTSRNVLKTIAGNEGGVF